MEDKKRTLARNMYISLVPETLTNFDFGCKIKIFGTTENRFYFPFFL